MQFPSDIPAAMVPLPLPYWNYASERGQILPPISIILVPVTYLATKGKVQRNGKKSISMDEFILNEKKGVEA